MHVCSLFVCYFNFNLYYFIFYFFDPLIKVLFFFHFSPSILIWGILIFSVLSLLLRFLNFFSWFFCEKNFIFNLVLNSNLAYIIFFNLGLLLLISNLFLAFLLKFWWFSILSFNPSLLCLFFC